MIKRLLFFGQRLLGIRRGHWDNWPARTYMQEGYNQRLAGVTEHLQECLDAAPQGPLRIISICAGDGRDVIGVVADHARRPDVTAWLVEQSTDSVHAGSQAIKERALQNSARFLHADATNFAVYAKIAPADIVLFCGVWGHVPIAERSQVIRALAGLCKVGGSVIWTRGISAGMQRLQQIDSLFAFPSWQRTRVTLTAGQKWAVVTHQLIGQAATLPNVGRIFHFEAGAGTRAA